MKFGKELKENAIDEWRRKYINYRLLKKLIGFARRELELREASMTNDFRHLEEGQHADSEITVTPTRRTSTISQAPLKRASLDENENFQTSPTTSPRIDPVRELGETSQSQAGSSQISLGKRLTFLRRVSTTLSQMSGQGDADLFKPSLGFGLKRNARYRYSSQTPLPNLLVFLSEAERRFFAQLDKEFAKVDEFYKAREKEALERFEVLKRQLEELEKHREEWNELRNSESTVHKRFDGHISGHLAIRKNITPTAHPKPEEYKAAKHKLKEAVFEYYQYLGMLKRYKDVNQQGFSKILKKCEKNLRIPCSTYYMTHVVKPSYFVSSEKVSRCLEASVDFFARSFEHGNRKKALEKLRLLSKGKKEHNFTSWRSGVFIGSGMVLMAEGIGKSFGRPIQREIDYLQPLLQLFGAELLPILFALLFHLNLYGFYAARINYPLIFEFDKRTMLEYVEFIEIPAFLFFLWSLCFYFSISDFWPDSILHPFIFPLTWLIIAMSVLFNPFDIFYRSSRWWTIRSVARVLTGGLLPVEFRDFFLGDQLVSMTYTIFNIGFLICTYHHHWSKVDEACTFNTWSTPALATIPNLLRFTQSIRRFIDSDNNYMHLVNGGKYFCGMVQQALYYNWRFNGSPSANESYALSLWIVAAIANTCYTYSWDIKMDWSLFQSHAQTPFLRKELVYRNVSVYYFAMIFNLFGRCAWITYLLPGSSLRVTAFKGYALAILELLRRWIWNYIRIENEHIGNMDGYRVTRDVPLPYIMDNSESRQRKAEYEDEEDKHSLKSTIKNLKDNPSAVKVGVLDFWASLCTPRAKAVREVFEVDANKVSDSSPDEDGGEMTADDSGDDRRHSFERRNPRSSRESTS